MSTMTIVEDLDVLEDGRPGLLCPRVAQVWRWSSLVLRVAKKLSATALSQHVAVPGPRPTLCWS